MNGVTLLGSADGGLGRRYCSQKRFGDFQERDVAIAKLESLAGSDAQVPLKFLLYDRHVIGAAGLSPSAQFRIGERSDDDIYAASLVTVCHSSPSPRLPVGDWTVDMLVDMHIFDAQT